MPPKLIHPLRTLHRRDDSGRRERPVADALARQRVTQAHQRLATGSTWADNDLVFATAVGTPINASNLRRSFSRLTARAGIGNWTPRELRHSAASLLSAAGVPIEEVMDLLGHVDTRMLERVYRHRVRPTVEAAAAPMERLFAESADSVGLPFGLPPAPGLASGQ